MKRNGAILRETGASKGASTKKVDFFRHEIQEWWKSNRRDFPWRMPVQPYSWLIAELMLRRTRASQVVPVYEAFMQEFPTPEDLSAADEGVVIEMLRPLGLAWRVPAFKQLALRIVTEHGGQVPRDRGALLALPGVGDYVAEAVRCFGFGEAVAIVDANTVRVSARYFGFEFDPDSRRSRPPARRRFSSKRISGGGNMSVTETKSAIWSARDWAKALVASTVPAATATSVLISMIICILTF